MLGTLVACASFAALLSFYHLLQPSVLPVFLYTMRCFVRLRVLTRNYIARGFALDLCHHGFPSILSSFGDLRQFSRHIGISKGNVSLQYFSKRFIERSLILWFTRIEILPCCCPWNGILYLCHTIIVIYVFR